MFVLYEDDVDFRTIASLWNLESSRDFPTYTFCSGGAIGVVVIGFVVEGVLYCFMKDLFVS
jgi:hypothetical protein